MGVLMMRSGRSFGGEKWCSERSGVVEGGVW